MTVVFLWYLLGALFSGGSLSAGGYQSLYSMTQTARYQQQATSKVLEIPYFVNEQTRVAAKRNAQIYDLIEHELESKEYARAQTECTQQQSRKNILINLANSAADQTQRAQFNEKAKSAKTDACDRYEMYAKLRADKMD